MTNPQRFVKRDVSIFRALRIGGMSKSSTLAIVRNMRYQVALAMQSPQDLTATRARKN